ncbi:hypothetical protein JL721_2760 [Aureococcus anophagefferens]|nr:hypothetical protein JL721_2760 [Aureococcus anophagefferens]
MVRGAKGAAVGAAGLVAVAIFAVSTSSSAAGAASDLLKASASTLYGAFGGEPTDLASLYRIEAGCEESRRALQSKQGAPWQKGGVGGAEMTAAVATAAPTLTEYWTVLWTEGTSELSYVWVMDHQDAGISAYVLVDTTGKAQGVTLASNDTTVNFVAENGAVYKADISGFDVTEILDYCDSSNIGTDGSSDCAGMGLDYWDYTGQLYFVDANLGYLMACDYDGGSAEILVKGIPDPYGVAVDKKTGLVIFTGEGAIYATHYASTDLTITEVTTFLSPSYYVTGVAMDSENGYVYWTGDDKVYRDTILNTQIETTPMEEKQQQRFLKLKNKIDALAAKRAATSDPEALAAIDAELAAARAKVKKARRVGADGATKECAVCGAPTARTVSVKGATVYWCSMACQRVGWKAAKAGLPQPNQKKKLLSEKAPEPEKTYPTEAADEDLRIQPKMERLRPKTKEVDFGVDFDYTPHKIDDAAGLPAVAADSAINASSYYYAHQQHPGQDKGDSTQHQKVTHKVTTGPQRIDPSKGDVGPAALPRVEVLGGAPASLSEPSDWDAWRASEVAFRNVDRARLRKRLAGGAAARAGRNRRHRRADSDDEFEDDLEIEEVAVSAEDMARLRAGGASDDDDDDLLVEEVQLSPEEVEKLRAGDDDDDDDDDLLVEEVQMSPEEVEKLRAGEESDDDDLQIEEVQMSPEEVEKLRAGEESSDDDLQIEEVQMSPEEVEKLRAGEESSDDDLQIEEVQMSPEEVEKLRAGEESSDDDLQIEEVQMSPEEVEKLRAGEESSDDDLQIEEVQMSPEEVEKLRAGEESSDDDLQIEEVQMSPKEVERLREDAAKDELREKKAAKKKAAARPGGFAAGDRVEICGLVAACVKSYLQPDFNVAAASRNGAKGTVERRAGARYAVVLDDGARLGAKPENLRRLADRRRAREASASAAPCGGSEPKRGAAGDQGHVGRHGNRMNYQRNTGAALEDMFSPRPPNVTAGDNPVLPKHRVPFYAGGLANTMNAGFAVNVAVTADLLGVGGNFSAASINLASYAPTEDYVFVEDPLGSTTDGPVFFRDHFDSSLTAYPQLAPANGGQTPSLWGPNSYNASELGLSARWASPHTTNGQNFPFYKPLKDGTLDFFGVCDTTEVSANEYLSNSAFAQQFSFEDWFAFQQATIAAGGFYLPTTRAWGLHLCIDPTDPARPYPCTSMWTETMNSDLSDSMIVDPLWFVHNPVQDAAALCEAHRAGLCNATNAHPLVTGSNETRYEYPVDVPMRWSPYPAPTPEPTPAPVATARKPKVRGCGRAALAEEKKCNKNKRCKWVFGSHACMSDCALASKSKSKCNQKKHCKYNKSAKKCKNKKHVCKYKTKKAHCRADESCGVKKGKDPKYDAKGNRVIKCRTRRTSRDKRDKHDAGR